MLKKELVIFTETDETGEFIKVNRLDANPGFFLLTLGQNRMVINGAELIEALQTIDHYGTLFDQELQMKRNRAAAPPKAIVVEAPVATKRGKKIAVEDEDAFILDPIMRLGPTDSELALEKQTKHMQGESLVLAAKK